MDYAYKIPFFLTHCIGRSRLLLLHTSLDKHINHRRLPPRLNHIIPWEETHIPSKTNLGKIFRRPKACFREKKLLDTMWKRTRSPAQSSLTWGPPIWSFMWSRNSGGFLEVWSYLLQGTGNCIDVSVEYRLLWHVFICRVHFPTNGPSLLQEVRVPL